MNLKHGMSRTSTYKSWQHMKERCDKPNDKSYKNYGGRGISICERWYSFEDFYKDMGAKPRNKTIDRKNNDGNYEPSNCQWATKQEQANNTRSNVKSSIYFRNDRNKYKAYVKIEGKPKYIGYFDTHNEAKIAIGLFNEVKY